jgi:hypothetical protein
MSVSGVERMWLAGDQNDAMAVIANLGYFLTGKRVERRLAAI